MGETARTSVILASGSPRRLELLRAVGIEPLVVVPQVDETALLAGALAALPPQEQARELALAKARAVLRQIAQTGSSPASEGQAFCPSSTSPLRAAGILPPGHKTHPQAAPPRQKTHPSPARELPASRILAADTIVFKAGVGALGKPAGADEAAAMLEALGNTSHEVITGVALINTHSGEETSFAETSIVHFGAYSREDIEAYLKAEPPYDKAGAYAIQGIWGAHVTHVEGSRDNVIGLPVMRLRELGLL